MTHSTQEASERIAVPVSVLNDLVDPAPCWFDHHGGCQAHGYLSLRQGEVCPEEAVKRLLRDAPRLPTVELVEAVRRLMENSGSATTNDGISYCLFCDANWGDHRDYCEWQAVRQALGEDDHG